MGEKMAGPLAMVADHAQGRAYRKVMVFLRFFIIGSSLSLKPVNIPNPANSGSNIATSSSSLICPRSMHCNAAIEVMSLVQEAIHMVVFMFIGSLVRSDLTPNALPYLKDPGGHQTKSKNTACDQSTIFICCYKHCAWDSAIFAGCFNRGF